MISDTENKAVSAGPEDACRLGASWHDDRAERSRHPYCRRFNTTALIQLLYCERSIALVLLLPTAGVGSGPLLQTRRPMKAGSNPVEGRAAIAHKRNAPMH